MDNKPASPLDSWNAFWRRHPLSMLALCNIVVFGMLAFVLLRAWLFPEDDGALLMAGFVLVFTGPLALVLIALDGYKLYQRLRKQP